MNISTAQSPVADDRLSTAQKASPKLSHRRLTMMLVLMGLTPVLTISALYALMPPTLEGELNAAVATEGLPSDEFYEVEFDERPEFEGGFIIVKNLSDEDWSLVNIQINNGYYQIYDTDPIKAQEERRYQLGKFWTRWGPTFKIRYTKLKNVRVYARLPSAERATYNYEFE